MLVFTMKGNSSPAYRRWETSCHKFVKSENCPYCQFERMNFLDKYHYMLYKNKSTEEELKQEIRENFESYSDFVKKNV